MWYFLQTRVVDFHETSSYAGAKIPPWQMAKFFRHIVNCVISKLNEDVLVQYYIKQMCVFPWSFVKLIYSNVTFEDKYKNLIIIFVRYTVIPIIATYFFWHVNCVKSYCRYLTIKSLLRRLLKNVCCQRAVVAMYLTTAD